MHLLPFLRTDQILARPRSRQLARQTRTLGEVPLNAQNWQYVKDALYKAMQLAPDERQRFLHELGANDAPLCAEVKSLLAAEEQMASNFLQDPASRASPLALQIAGIETTGSLKPGQTFEERFVLVRILGEGGMGRVWLAEQTLPVRRTVALKLIKAGVYDEAVVQRFAAERQSMATMDHPAIAKVFEAGSTPQGQPYFVMEFVAGAPITQYCDGNALSIGARLELFIQICDGVQHAHQKAVIHRDLKPANILVTEVDGKSVPRIIDFGIAKPVTTTSLSDSPLTSLGQFLGTPGYISPEQADFSRPDIDTRSDVYSLGVILYVLLAGVRPFDSKPGQGPPVYEWLKKLREDDPPRPSARLTALGEHSAAISAARGMRTKQLAALLHRDLDWITLRALAKDREHRYSTPADLAADLRRHLRHEPVLARPASLVYRGSRYARRHRVAVSVSGLLLLLLIAFSAWQSLNVRWLAQERERVMRERDRAVRVTDLLSGVFTLPESSGQGDTITARELLDRRVAELRRTPAIDPDARSQLLHLLARAYLNLGLFAGAEGVSRAAYDARLELHGIDDARTLESLAQLGWIKSHEGEDAEAESMERAALARERRVLGPDNALTLETLHKLSIIVGNQGRLEESATLKREWTDALERKSASGGTR